MAKLTVLSLLTNYEKSVSNGDVQFLKKDSDDQKHILNLLNDIIEDFKDEEGKPISDLSGELDPFETHKKGCDLWHELASLALMDIRKDSKGNSELFKFLNAATEFEDILYGLEPYYRDHTLHSLWVYLIGEDLLRGQLSNIYDNLNWYFYNDVERDAKKEKYKCKLVKNAKKIEDLIYKQVNINKDAIWCIIALCHDLGYSLSKLDNLNKKALAVLEFINLPNFRQIGYSLDLDKQYLVSQFLELMAMDVRIVPDQKLKDVLIKCYRDDPTYWTLCKALEKKQHGILSAYLIYKILGIFQDSWIRGPAEEWGLEKEEALENITRGTILFAIAQHEFEFAFISKLSGLSEILILADELEEFSRYGRHTLTRKYYDTIANSSITFNPENPIQGQDVEIFITYDVKDHLKKEAFYRFFISKAEQLCKFYSLDQIDEKSKYSTIKTIKISVNGKHGNLYFQIFEDESKNIGKLPKTRIGNETLEEKEYNLICIDDEIYYKLENTEKISLKTWFDNTLKLITSSEV